MKSPTRGFTIPAVLALAVLTGCGAASRAGSDEARSPRGTTEHRTTAAQLADPIVVRRPLSAAARAELLAWMNHWRACMADNGVSLPPPQVHPRHIAVDVEAADGYLKAGSGLPQTPSAFMRTSMSCIGSLGGPPATFLRTGGIVDLFKGTCALQRSTKPGGQ
jgi:hypothetical protein